MRRVGRSRGIVHVHTAFSHDGLLQPAELARICRARGLAFAAIAEHAEDMDDDATSALVRACEAQSGPDFVLIPGIEHRFRTGVHILALGQTRLMPGMPMTDSLRALVSEGCVLVAAHCQESDDLPASLLEKLSAVEIWNVSRHTRYLPGSDCVAAYRKWAWAYPGLFAIGGLDMHAGTEWGCEVVPDDALGPSRESVLGALRAGRFATTGRFLSFGSRAAGHAGDLAFAMGDALVGVRDLRNRVLYCGRYVKD